MKKRIIPITGKRLRNGSFDLLVSVALNGVIASALITTLGCTHFAKTHAKAKHELEEHSRALTTAVVDTLQLEPAAERNQHTTLALQLAREDQRIEGLPDVPIPVEPLLGIFPSNTPPAVAQSAQEKAGAALENRFARIEKLLTREHAAEERLQDFGATYEAERDERRLR